jgi:hypothetical protein
MKVNSFVIIRLNQAKELIRGISEIRGQKSGSAMKVFDEIPASLEL